MTNPFSHVEDAENLQRELLPLLYSVDRMSSRSIKKAYKYGFVRIIQAEQEPIIELTLKGLWFLKLINPTVYEMNLRYMNSLKKV